MGTGRMETAACRLGLNDMKGYVQSREGHGPSLLLLVKSARLRIKQVANLYRQNQQAIQCHWYQGKSR